MKSVVVLFAIWTIACFGLGVCFGAIYAQRSELRKNEELYQKRENNTLEQEKNAQKIKVIYRDLKNDKKDCDFVLDFDVSKCLSK